MQRTSRHLGRGLLPLLLLLALTLALGVGNAGGRSLATATITVEVVGKGTVKSPDSAIKCGNGDKTCYLVFSASDTATLAHDAPKGWDFNGWTLDGADCADPCVVDTSTGDHLVIATFTKPSGSTTNTLSVGYTGSGAVSAPQNVPGGTEINCGSAPPGADCEWTVPTGSTLTVFETPGTSSTVPLSLTVNGSGTVTGGGINCGNGNTTCSVNETPGSDVTLTATPATTFDFLGWGGACALEGTSLTCTVTMSGAQSVTATFTGIGSESGTTAPTSTGNVFAGWAGDCSGTSVACTVELSQDRAVSANWEASNAATATLRVTVSGRGTVKGGGLSCSGPANCSRDEPLGSTVTLTAEPAAGYLFTAWAGGVCDGPIPTCTMTFDAAKSLTATFSPLLSVTVSGNGAVTAGTGAINCGNGATICSAPFAQNATVTLTAVPAPAVGTAPVTVFAGWSGACGGTVTTCTVLMSEAKSVTATFSVGTPGTAGTGLTLTVTVTGNGTVTGSGISCGLGASTCSATNRPLNSTVTLTAVPSGGATFSGWGGACAGTATTCTVVMTSSKSVTATFVGGTASFQLSVSVSGSGTVTGGGINCGNGASGCTVSEPAGTSVTLAATPASGSTFSGWGGACSGTARTCTVTMSAARSVTATFVSGGGGGATAGTLTIRVSGRGTVSTSLGRCVATGPLRTCVQHFAVGAKATLTATPATGASFLGWSGNCAGTRTTCSLTMTGARTATARFSGGTAPPPTPAQAVLRSLAAPKVVRAGGAFRVTLRFRTTAGGLARVRGLRAGRVAASVALRVAAGRATIGPFPVQKPGLYTFEVRLVGRVLRWRACLGLCGARAKAAPFVLTREAPTVTRSGDAWSVTLHTRATQISDARIRVYRGTRLVLNRHFLGRAARFAVGPFLLGEGNYTLRLTAVDPYGRSRTLSWVVALARP